MVLSVLTFIMNSWASSAALLLRMIDFPNAAIISSCFRALLAVRLRPADDVPTITFESVSWMEFQHAEGLGIVSDVTGHGDGLAMNIAGGAAEVQAQALEYGLTPAEVAEAARGTSSYFSAMASEATAADLNIVSDVTGRGDGLTMNIAGAAAEVQAQALEYGLTPAKVAEAARGTVAFFSEFRAEGLGIVSDVTLEYGLTPAEVAEAARGTVAFFSEFRAKGLGIVSDVTGHGDGLAMNIERGAAEVQAQALE